MPAPKVRSKDPKQQQLRDKKRQWNGLYRDLSQKLKGAKDTINGRGNTKLGLPPSNIKDELPPEVGSLLNQLAGEFQSLMGEAESIIATQAEYARTRRHRQPKKQQAATPAAAVPAAATPQEQDKVVETLSRIGSPDYQFVSEGSSKLSRFWQYATAIFGLSKKEYNRQRVGLLSQAADMYYSILDLENDVLTVSLKNVPNTIAKYKKFKYNFDSFVGTFKGVEAMIERSANEKGVAKPEEDALPSKSKPTEEPVEDQTINAPAPQQEQKNVPIPNDLAKIKNDILLLFNAGLAKQNVLDLNEMLTEYDSEDDENMKSMWADRIKDNYNALTKLLANEVQKRYGPANIRDIQDIIDLVRKNKEASISALIVKTAHNSMTRHLKRQLVKMRTSNKTAPVRLQIDVIIDEMKKTLIDIMDSLEKNLSVEELNKYIEKLHDEKDGLKRPLHVLNVFFMKEFFSKKEHQQKKQKGNVMPEMTGDEEMMDYVMKRKLKRELSEDLG